MHSFVKLPLAEHILAERAAIDALRAAGFAVERDGSGVVIVGDGYTLRARVARALLPDLLPRHRQARA